MKVLSARIPIRYSCVVFRALENGLRISSRGIDLENGLPSALADAERRLQKYEDIFGRLDRDELALKEALLEKDDALRALRLELESKQAVSVVRTVAGRSADSRFQEIAGQQVAIDQLAVSWDELNQKLELKLHDAQEIDQKLSKLSSEVRI
jgi:hypothetical protein